jgi:hypothetical protein
MIISSSTLQQDGKGIGTRWRGSLLGQLDIELQSLCRQVLQHFEYRIM